MRGKFRLDEVQEKDPTRLDIACYLSDHCLRELSKIYGEDAARVVTSLGRPAERYYVRANTLRANISDIINLIRVNYPAIEAHPIVEEALSLPVEGPLEVPVFEKKVVVDRFTAESVMQGANVYAPGVVCCRKIRPGNLVTIVNVDGRVVGSGLARLSEAEILACKRGMAVALTYPLFKVPSFRETEEFRRGLIYPQSLPAMVTSKILDPKENETVVDLTCSPGGKLTHISQLMRNRGRVIGIDRNKQKIWIASETVKRMGCRNVTLIIHDGRYVHRDFPALRPDKILIDPPCSALGLRPKLQADITTREIQALADYQKQFIKAASMIIKPTGRIVYSVCTWTLMECEEVVRFASEECGLQPEKQALLLGSSGLGETNSKVRLTQRFHPHIDGIGYFIASL